MYRRNAVPVGQLMDLDDVDALLGSAARQPEIRLVRDGSPVSPQRWVRARRLGGRLVEDLADPDRIFDEFANGATVVLQGLHLTWPPMGRWCDRLQREISHPVQANAYLTPGGAAGLSAHADDHDVFVVQSVGTKRWDIEGIGQIELRCGDVLYLPAGTRHAAFAQDGVSLHVTIGVPTVTGGSVVRRALERLDDERLSLPLPLGFARRGEASEELIDAMAAVLDAASIALASIDAAQLAAVEAERAHQRPAAHRTGRLGDLADLSGLGPLSVVRLREDRAPHISMDVASDGRCRVRMSDRVLLLPTAMTGAVTALLGGAPCRVGELPGLDPDDAVVLSRRLVREGVIEIVRHDRTRRTGPSRPVEGSSGDG